MKFNNNSITYVKLKLNFVSSAKRTKFSWTIDLPLVFYKVFFCIVSNMPKTKILCLVKIISYVSYQVFDYLRELGLINTENWWFSEGRGCGDG